ncbi:MAG: NADH-quinone oxidoreductase subunit L [Gammaproteobacteria bacterium]|nr:NADH-quinone oxidoreductase subunit L [Gammaproteobacteria bacterium]
MSLPSLAFIVMMLPLIGALVAGLLGKRIGRVATHRITIFLVGVSFLLSLYLVWQMVVLGAPAQEIIIYHWVNSGTFHFDVGILLDRLSAVMIAIVSFISFAVHIYTIGYMSDDPGYERFFSYVSLFTFAMLTLVLANNFLLMFFGWEGVGFVSYLLIGFWFGRDSAVFGSLKAFIANRVGDVGFVLALAVMVYVFGSLDYHTVFAQAPLVVDKQITLFSNYGIPTIGLICFLLFVGAMAKSAQVPLHVWLPESMEGPTPISALIHAATMVTAGIYMVARCSWLFEYSPGMQSVILVLGASTCFFMGILAVFQNDIKRAIAYSTISQLGYMAAALGVSAYDAAIFHLITHAFFKALLFLAAGSVILAMHHEQDMRKMGGLAKHLPVTCLTFWIGALALAAFPPFSGFYSKDAIIELVHLSTIPGAGYAYFCVVAGAFLTSVYIFRVLFLTFYGESRSTHHGPVTESPWVVLFPLIILAIPSFIAGGLMVGPMLYAPLRVLGHSIFVLPQHDALSYLAEHYEGATQAALMAGHSLTFWLVIAGIFVAWFIAMFLSRRADVYQKRFPILAWLIEHKYGFDDFNQYVLVRGVRAISRFFYAFTDLIVIDGFFVNGTGNVVRWLARVSRRLQTGYIYHYAFVMGAGVLLLLIWFVGM